MHEPDCASPSLTPQRGDEVPCRGGVGQEQLVEGESAEVVGTGGEMHDGITVTHRTHGFVNGFLVSEIADGRVHARIPADRYNIVAAGPQSRHSRRAEIP